MSKRSFSADDRPPVRFVDNAELAYVATRYRQVHDFWHTVFGCNTTLLGETTLKALEFTQVWAIPNTKGEVCVLSPSSQVLSIYTNVADMLDQKFTALEHHLWGHPQACKPACSQLTCNDLSLACTDKEASHAEQCGSMACRQAFR